MRVLCSDGSDGWALVDVVRLAGHQPHLHMGCWHWWGVRVLALVGWWVVWVAHCERALEKELRCAPTVHIQPVGDDHCLRRLQGEGPVSSKQRTEAIGWSQVFHLLVGVCVCVCE